MSKNTKKDSSKKSSQANKKKQGFFKRIEGVLLKFPLLTLGVLLVLLFGLIYASNEMRQPEPVEEKPTQESRSVQTYSIGVAPTIKLSGKVEKNGVITIVAQTAGIVQKANVKEGDEISRGKSVVSLSTNYYGGNSFSLQRQVAQKQKDFTAETYDIEKDIIGKNREIAIKAEDNSNELREIDRKSLEDSKELLSFNESLLEGIDSTIESSTDSAEVASALQLKSQLLSGNNQLKAGIRALDYTTEEDNPPKRMETLNKDIVLRQLEIQEKALDLNKEVTDLQYKIARVNEALMYPGAPFAGKVERVHVKKGQAVNPGTPLVTLHCDTLATQLVVTVPADIARSVNTYEQSKLYIGDSAIVAFPEYVSTEATHGQLYSIIFAIPETYSDIVTNMGFVQVEIPVGLAQTGVTIPFIPLDAVYQNELSSTIFVIEDGLAVSREVTLGAVRGSYVQVIEGVDPGDVVVLDRSVVDGELVQPL